jgi:hypothetical protein
VKATGTAPYIGTARPSDAARTRNRRIAKIRAWAMRNQAPKPAEDAEIDALDSALDLVQPIVLP